MLIVIYLIYLGQYYFCKELYSMSELNIEFVWIEGKKSICIPLCPPPPPQSPLLPNSFLATAEVVWFIRAEQLISQRSHRKHFRNERKILLIPPPPPSFFLLLAQRVRRMFTPSIRDRMQVISNGCLPRFEIRRVLRIRTSVKVTTTTTRSLKFDENILVSVGP